MSRDYDTKPPEGVRVTLGGKKFPNLYAIVDADDAERVQELKWHAQQTNQRANDVLYATARNRHGHPQYVLMHRFILGLTDPRIKVDHINHDGLDNRKANLRIGTQQQNSFNARPSRKGTSRFKGVHWSIAHRSWEARITHNRRVYLLGSFESEEDAARAYDEAARSKFGEFAWLNFPEARDE